MLAVVTMIFLAVVAVIIFGLALESSYWGRRAGPLTVAGLFVVCLIFIVAAAADRAV